jgi:hypothetical protein
VPRGSDSLAFGIRAHAVRVVLVTLVALAAAPLASTQPFTAGPRPTNPATSFRAEGRLFGEPIVVSWQSPERYAERRGRSLAAAPTLVERDGTRYVTVTRETNGAVQRRLFAAEPDGFSQLEFALRYVDFVLARARSGRLTLRATRLRGAPAWRARFGLRANDCAGLARGRATIWLSRTTLLPLRVDVRRGQTVSSEGLAYRDVNARLPASDFATPDVGPRPQRRDDGFRRTSAAAAREHLSYRPRLPTELPRGFELAVSGWAPRSGVTGAEGSNAPFRELFAAVYRRGIERIDVTQRLSRAGGWGNDPFGGECLFQYTERVALGGGVRATYGIGPETEPHLYWRQGRVLYTVSGPFPRRDLVAIARSLR